MMQELQTIGATEEAFSGTVSGRSFAVLFKLAGSDSVNVKTLGKRLELSEQECARIVEDLQRRYLVDIVSRLDGKAVRETLRLTEEGEAVLSRSLEQMCELPEFS